MSEVKLLPCPGCGLIDESIVRLVSFGRKDRVQCGMCGWQGPAESTEAAAIMGWNTRALTPRQQAADLMYEALKGALTKRCGCRHSHIDDWHTNDCPVPAIRAALAAADGKVKR